MKLDLVPESMLERFGQAAGLIPAPLIHTMVAMLMSRSIMAATRLGVFRALGADSLTDQEVADKCRMDPAATRKLMRALQGIGYVRHNSGRYALTPVARSWLLADGRADLTDAILHRYLDMKLMDQFEDYLRHGQSIQFHSHLSADEWGLYVRGQKAHAAVVAPEIVARVPLPAGATRMLDAGGGHGLFSDALCRRYEKLNAVVFDLPKAIQNVDRSGLSARVTFTAGDVLVQDLGKDEYDLVLMANLVHHFSSEQNEEIMQKAHRALRIGGHCVVADFIVDNSKAGQIPALLDFYFAVTSGAGSWTAADIVGWMRRAPLEARKPIRLRSAPGMALLVGTKTQT